MAYAAHIPYLDITNADIKDDGTEVKMEVKVAGNIEEAVNNGAFFGYVALTNNFQDMLAFTTHVPLDDNGVDDDGPSGVHTHIVDVIGECDDGLKVSPSNFSPAQENLELTSNTVEVDGVSSDLTGEFTGVFASFTIHTEGSDVCVVIDDFSTVEEEEEEEEE